MRSEIDQVVGMNQNINHEMLKLLVYSGHVLNETMRLWPPVAAVNRITNEDLFVNGKLIPKETEVSVRSFRCSFKTTFFKINEFVLKSFLFIRRDEVNCFLKIHLRSDPKDLLVLSKRVCCCNHFFFNLKKLFFS